MLKISSVQQLIFVLLFLIVMVSSTSNYARRLKEIGNIFCSTTLSSSNSDNGEKHSADAIHNLKSTLFEDDHLKGIFYN